MDTRKGVRDPDGGTVRVHPSKDGIEVAILDIHTGDWTASAFLVLAHENHNTDAGIYGTMQVF